MPSKGYKKPGRTICKSISFYPKHVEYMDKYIENAKKFSEGFADIQNYSRFVQKAIEEFMKNHPLEKEKVRLSYFEDRDEDFD